MIVELVRIFVSIVVLLGVAIGVSSIPTVETVSTQPLPGFEELVLELSEVQTETPESETPEAPEQISEPKAPEPVSPTEPEANSETSIALPDPSTLLNTPRLQEEPVPLSFADINERARNSIVNVLCVAQNATAAGSITGTGVMIDPRGIILTNAHIAQFFLLRDHPVKDSIDCSIRTGSPARKMYRAEPLFLHPQWIIENSDLIANSEPVGTGKYDYAFLVITGPIDPETPPPNSFSSLPIAKREVVEGEQILLASYPAGFLGGELIEKNLYAASSISEVGQLFTFEQTSIDVFSTGGTVVAQQGSSGGAAVDATGSLVGLFVTSTLSGDTSERDLRALSTSYITRSFEEYNNLTLEQFLAGDIVDRVQEFRFLVFPTLSQLLIDNLK